LAEVMIDAVDLVLAPEGEDLAVERLCGLEVGAERLLHDDPPPAVALVEAALDQVRGDQAEEAPGHGEVEEQAAARLVVGAEFLEELGEAVIAVEGLGGGVVHAPAEPVPGGRIELLARMELFDAVLFIAEPLAELLGGELKDVGADKGKLLG